MNVTKSLADLCPLLIDEIYGELPSRIFATLITRGRSSLAQLHQYTSLTQRQLRHGITVLIQQNLLYFHTDNETRLTSYEANPEPAYNLLRTGKILEMMDTTYGPGYKDIMQSLFILGQTRIADLTAAYEQKIRLHEEARKAAEEAKKAAEEENVFVDEEPATPAPKTPDLPVRSTKHLNALLCRLVEWELVEVVHFQTLVSPEDIYKDVSERVLKVKFPGGVKGGKGKLEYDEAVAMELRKIRRESKTLKRKLEESGGATKRRKLLNGVGIGVNGVNGVSGLNGVNEDHEPEGDPVLDQRQVIRVNYERCAIELRNRRLVNYAADTIGPHTSYVYGTVLKLLSKKISRCHDDPRMDIGDMPDENKPSLVVTTNEILNGLPTSVTVDLGIAKTSKDNIDTYTAQMINTKPPEASKIAAILNGNNAEDEGSDSDDHYEEPNGHGNVNGAMEEDTKEGSKGTKDSKVRFAEGKESRVDMLRQHLYLLAENNVGFVRQCAQDQWTVDFGPLIQHLKEAELDTVIERTVGRQGLRLVRVLRKKGKLDEKALPTVALMKKGDVQTKMLEMETAGFVDVQEVPRDASRTANRTIFLWYTPTDRCFDQLLDRTYTTMVRCLQRLAAERRKEKDVLLLTKRTDVKGREKEMMQEGYYKRFAAFLEVERKLLGQVMRCDELIAVLRDY